MTTVSLSPLKRVPSRGRRLGRSAAVVAAVLVVALAGCAKKVDRYEATGSVPDDYRIAHPILIEEQVATMDVPVSVDTMHLTGAIRANIAYFAQSYLTSGAAVIAVVAPSGSPNELAAAAIAVEVEDTLRQNGINPRAIDYRVYRASAEERIAPVRIAFSRIAAGTAPCAPWTDQTASTAANRHYESFGCATQQNLAAVVENPLDLLYPRGMTPADTARRASVLEKYRNGEAFQSDTSRADGGDVAQGVGQ